MEPLINGSENDNDNSAFASDDSEIEEVDFFLNFGLEGPAREDRRDSLSGHAHSDIKTHPEIKAPRTRRPHYVGIQEEPEREIEPVRFALLQKSPSPERAEQQIKTPLNVPRWDYWTSLGKENRSSAAVKRSPPDSHCSTAVDCSLWAQEVRSLLLPQDGRESTPQRAWSTLRSLVQHRQYERMAQKRHSTISDVCERLRLQTSTFTLIKSGSHAKLRDLLAAVPLPVLKELVDPETGFNPLQTAILSEDARMVSVLSELGGLELLLASDFADGQEDGYESCLHRAIMLDNVEVVHALLAGLPTDDVRRQLLMAEAVIAPRGEHISVSALHLAAMHGREKVMDYLVQEQRMAVDLPCSTKATAIYLAAMKGQLNAVTRLLKLGARIDFADNEHLSFLHYAILSGNTEVVSVALDAAATNDVSHLWSHSNPLVFAAYIGDIEVIRTLLKNKAIAQIQNIPTKHLENTALHVVCSDSRDPTAEICKLLLAAGANVRARNARGRTSFINAVYHAKVHSMIALAQALQSPRHLAFLDVTDSGHTVWDYAIRHNDARVLVTLLEIARFCLLEENLQEYTLMRFFKFPENMIGGTPLHAAAKLDDLQAVKILLKYVPGDTVDSNGDTFLHTAAREGRHLVLQSFTTEASLVNHQNNQGDTALHIACSFNQEKCITALLGSCDVSLVNAKGRTALHELCINDDVSYAVLQEVTAQMTDSTWKYLCIRDCLGKTALHYVAGHRIEHQERVMRLFFHSFSVQALCNVKDSDGNTAMHEAARLQDSKNLKALLKTFGVSADVNQRNKNGLTALHIAAQCAVVESIGPLVGQGADMLVADNDGNPVLHSLLKLMHGTESTRHKEVIVELLRNADVWYKRRRRLRSTQNECNIANCTSASQLLLCETYNAHGISALFYAAQLGCKDVMEVLFSAPEALRYGDEQMLSDAMYYDVTDYVPATLSPLRNESLRKSVTTITVVSDAEVLTDTTDDASWTRRDPEESLLECILKDVPLRGPLLQLTPLQEIAQTYFRPYKIVYAALMFWHVAFMGVFSYSSLQVTTTSDLRCLYNTSLGNSTVVTTPSSIFPLVLILTWPAIIILFNFSKIIMFVRRHHLFRDLASSSRQSIARSVEGTHFNFFWILGVAFSWLSIAWFVSHQVQYCNQDYILCVVLITGWLYTVHLTQGLRSVHQFSVVLSRIMVKDFPQFFFILVFVITGYSLAFYILTLPFPRLQASEPTFQSTIFLVFGWGVGIGTFYDNDPKEYYDRGKSLEFGQAVFVTFAIAVSVMLMNMFIAIMNDSYAAVSDRSNEAYLVTSLRWAVGFEAQFPYIAKLLSKLYKRHFILTGSRYFVKLPSDRLKSSAKVGTSLPRGLRPTLSTMSSVMDTLCVDVEVLKNASTLRP